MHKIRLKLLWLSMLLVTLLLAACGDETNLVFPTPTTSNVAAATATVSSQPVATTPVATTTATTQAATTQAVTTTVPATTSVATPATTAPQTAIAEKATPTPVATPGTDPNNIQNVVYLKESKLLAYNIESGKSFELAKNLSVFRYLVSPDHKKVAFFINNNLVIDLGLVSLDGAKASAAVILDTQLGNIVKSTEDNPFASMYLKAFSLDFSPDSATLAYTKTNPNGPGFESWTTPVKPTEVWLVGLAGKSKAQRLVPNTEKNFMYKVTYSPDGERIGFIRTASFPSDVSGESVIWSVHKDGSKLSLLADGEKLAKQANSNSTDYQPGLITSFYWNSPLSISFNVGLGSTWVHDLSNAKDRLLIGFDATSNDFILYDPFSHRYAFRKDAQIYTIGTLGGQTKPVLVTSRASKILSFYNNTVMFVTESNTVALQSVNDDGSLVSVVLGLKALHKSDANIRDALPANGSWIVSWSEDNYKKSFLAVYSGDGSALTNPPYPWLGGEFIRLSPDLFLLNDYSKSLQLLDLRNQPAIITIDLDDVYYYAD